MATPSLFEQMRLYLECRSDEGRRTIFLRGKAAASTLSAALHERLPAPAWHEDSFQRGVLTDEYGGSLVVLATQETLDSDQVGAVHITLTTHGLDDDGFAAARAEWWAWWSSHVRDGELVVR
jgi:hypothetical protein